MCATEKEKKRSKKTILPTRKIDRYIQRPFVPLVIHPIIRPFEFDNMRRRFRVHYSALRLIPFPALLFLHDPRTG